MCDQPTWIYVNIFNLGVIRLASVWIPPLLMASCPTAKLLGGLHDSWARSLQQQCLQVQFKFLHIIWSLHFLLGTDCLFVTWNIVSKRRAKRTSDVVSAVSPCCILFFFFGSVFLSDCQSLSGRRHRAAKCWRGSKLWGGVGESLYSQKKNEMKKCCFEQVSFGLTNKNIPVKKSVCLVSLESGCLSSAALVLNQSGLNRCPCQSSGAPPWGSGVSDSVTAATHSFYIFFHGRGQFPHWAKNCGEPHSQSNSNGRWLHRGLWAFPFPQKKTEQRKKKIYINDTNWIRQDDGDEEEEEKWWLMFSFWNKMMNYKAILQAITVDLSILQLWLSSRRLPVARDESPDHQANNVRFRKNIFSE